MLKFLLLLAIGFHTPLSARLYAQVPLHFEIDDLNELIRNGTVLVTHSPIDIGSISSLFDNDPQSLARSANVNPFVITLSFPYKVTFTGASILQTYGDGWWTLEAADSALDLMNQSGSYLRLADMTSLMDNVPDMISFTSISKRFLRLTVRRTTGDDYVHLNEFQLLNATAEVDIVSVCARPSELWLLPNTSTAVKLIGYDSSHNGYELTDDVLWALSPANLVSFLPADDGAAIASGMQTGNGLLFARWKDAYETAIDIHVVDDFKPVTDVTRDVKVALVIIDPAIEAENGLRFHERFGWADPSLLAQALADSLNAAAEGAVDYKIISTYDETMLYAALEGTYISVDSMYRLFLEPGWETFHELEQTGGFAFDYNGLLDAHSFCDQSNAGEIDEVWVYSMPFTGMYESRLTGDGAFWYNSPPLDGNDCIDQLPVMGFNYERGIAEAMHSYGHRVESAMVHTFGRWDYNAGDKNDWELFASIDLSIPDSAHIGNIHYPPNGVSDYDYGNTTYVNSFADNWSRYPFLFNEQRSLNCETWNCSHDGYMSWWFRHLPRFTCKNGDGILNNWWVYIVDYNEGREHERMTDDCGCMYVYQSTSAEFPSSIDVLQVYPNPVDDELFILLKEETQTPNSVNVIRMDGTCIEEMKFSHAGNSLQLDVRSLPGGMYFVEIRNEKEVIGIAKFVVTK